MLIKRLARWGADRGKFILARARCASLRLAIARRRLGLEARPELGVLLALGALSMLLLGLSPYLIPWVAKELQSARLALGWTGGGGLLSYGHTLTQAVAVILVEVPALALAIKALAVARDILLNAHWHGWSEEELAPLRERLRALEAREQSLDLAVSIAGAEAKADLPKGSPKHPGRL